MYIYDQRANKWIRLRATPEYRRRKRMIRDVWIVVGIPMIFMPAGIVLAVALLATFLSFSFLDETPYRFPTEEKND